MAELGKIKPEKRYQTTDGKKFEDKADAVEHQAKLNEEKENVGDNRKRRIRKKRKWWNIF